jgi:hypothetical protein
MTSNDLGSFLKNLKKQDLIISSRLDQWFNKNPELVLTDDDLETIRRLTQPRGERVRCFTGSQAGTCERKQVFGWLGLPQTRRINPHLVNLFMDGTWRHIRWQIILPKAIPGLEVEQRVDSERYQLRGSFDLVHRKERWAGEIKGTRMLSKVIWEGVYEQHQQQGMRYLIAADEDPNMPHFEKYVYFYEDKTSNDWQEIVVDRKNYALEDHVLRELKRLNNATRTQELPGIIPECKTGKGQFFKECPYSTNCLKIKSWASAEQITRSSQRRSAEEADVRSTAVELPRIRVRKPSRTGG